MVSSKRSLLCGGIGALLLCAGSGAGAQDSNMAASAAAPTNGAAPAIGNPQLRDFSLTPQRTIVSQPTPQAAPPAELAPPPPQPTPQRAPTRTNPAQVSQRRAGEAQAAAQPAEGARVAPPAARPQPDLASPTFDAPAPPPPTAVPDQPVEAPAPAPNPATTPWYYYAIPAAALALLGMAVVRRRRRVTATGLVEEAPLMVAEPPRPRPDPVPRPWLELSLRAERASFTSTEAVVQFELEISNTGGSPARNLRIDVKMFNAGAEQDREIGAFFKTAGRESTKLTLPVVEAGVTGVIKGQVKLPVDEMRAVRLDERLLFIPVVAVNALYGRGNGLTGQTSRSYVIGRELQQTSEKMGAFRVDQGPRIWRTIGQREHKLAKRV